MTPSPVSRPRRLAAVGAIAALSALLASCAGSAGGDAGGEASAASPSSFRIAVFEASQAALVDTIVGAFEEALVAEMGPDVSVTFDVKNANGDQTLLASIARDLASSDYDAFAVSGSNAIVALSDQVKDRPIFGIDMANPVTLGLAESLEEPGGNLTGSVAYVDPVNLLDKVLEIQPDIETLGTIYNPSAQNMKEWIVDLREATDDTGITLVEATTSGAADVNQAARSLSGRVDAVLVGPDTDVLSSFDSVASAAQGSDLPLYTNGGAAATPGVLASIGPDYADTARAAGVVAATVLKGADVAKTAFAQTTILDLTVNTTTAATLGMTVGPDVLADAAVVE